MPSATNPLAIWTFLPYFIVAKFAGRLFAEIATMNRMSRVATCRAAFPAIYK